MREDSTDLSSFAFLVFIFEDIPSVGYFTLSIFLYLFFFPHDSLTVSPTR